MPATASPVEPPAERIHELVRCWESRDVDGLLALLKKDVVFTMPPWAMWFRGRAAVGRFIESPRFGAFWSSGLRIISARANGSPALVFYRDRGKKLHSIQVPRFDGHIFSELVTFVGPTYLHGFKLPESATERFSRPALS
jgi:RNA polymerase sigma-70 factor (ECF subfamily)